MSFVTNVTKDGFKLQRIQRVIFVVQKILNINQRTKNLNITILMYNSCLDDRLSSRRELRQKRSEATVGRNTLNEEFF